MMKLLYCLVFFTTGFGVILAEEVELEIKPPVSKPYVLLMYENAPWGSFLGDWNAAKVFKVADPDETIKLRLVKAYRKDNNAVVEFSYKYPFEVWAKMLDDDPKNKLDSELLEKNNVPLFSKINPGDVLTAYKKPSFQEEKVVLSWESSGEDTKFKVKKVDKNAVEITNGNKDDYYFDNRVIKFISNKDMQFGKTQIKFANELKWDRVKPSGEAQREQYLKNLKVYRQRSLEIGLFKKTITKK